MFTSVLFMFSCESNTTQEIQGVVKNPTYSEHIATVMNAKCVSCHSPSGKDDQPYLENYEQVKDAIENGVLLCRIDGSCGPIMPQGGKMPQATIDMIQLWKTNNYPN